MTEDSTFRPESVRPGPRASEAMTGGLTALKLPQPDFIDVGKGLSLIVAAGGWAAIADAARGASGCCGGKIEAEGHGPRHSAATTFES